MIHDFWFPSPISSEYLNKVDNEKIKEYCLFLRDSDAGRTVSNIGGWQSNDLDIETPELQELFSEIRNQLHVLKTEAGMKDNVELDISNIWINVNEQNSYNDVHTHPGSAYSGVYYVKCNQDDSGSIMFRSPIVAHEYHLNCELFKDNRQLVAYTRCLYPPVEQNVLFFPSWLGHNVMPNNSSEMRISISFNTQVLVFGDRL
jgi:uncharacterized protein (TIGR02466 family)